MRAIDDLDAALSVAIAYFRRHFTVETDHGALIRRAVDAAVGVFPDANAERLREYLERSVSVHITRYIELTDPAGHTPWLAERSPQIDWRFWRRYRDYLTAERRLPLHVIDRLDEVSDETLGLLENPTVRDSPFDRRGLVMGYVQSGKTTNYSAVINKALDAGYKLIIVLAGTLNNLRSQTQIRIDEEVLGMDTAQSQLSADAHGAFGVGKVLGYGILSVGSLTSWRENGDFRVASARRVAVQPGDIPLVLVVKKNGTILRHLIRYFRDFSAHARTDADGRVRVHNIPLLVIDDEADLAGVNTRDIPTDEDGNPLPDYDPTTTNRLIRQLLSSFTQVAYVGYTATPFANIFIHPDAPHVEVGEDLFPRSFIINLPAPSNYIGPGQLLGLGDDTGMPVFRGAEDAEAILPVRHEKTHLIHGLCPSLREAIRGFLLAAAARSARGQRRSHNSMLVHVTQFQDVQDALALLIRRELQMLQRRLQYGGPAGERTPLVDELLELWLSDFVPTSLAMGATPPAWEDVAAELETVVSKTLVKTINGRSTDILDYRENADTGINVIAVGGNKLSRGLTLEGLSVSYFRRTSKMYDTLMQMGRWFGYRDGYADLCRIYTTDELLAWMRHIAQATEELRAEFDYMAAVGATPREFGLRVASHPVLLVTSRVKMREGVQLILTYQGDISETTVFHRDPAALDRNMAAVNDVLASLRPPHDERNHRFIWTTGSDSVLTLLQKYRTHPDAPRANAALLAQYIEEQNSSSPPELTTWTVALISQAPRQNVKRTTVAGLRVYCIQRSPRRDTSSKFSIQRLLSPADEFLDLDDLFIEAAYTRLLGTLDAEGRTHPDWTASDAPSTWLRSLRPPTHGMLLIYPLDPTHLQEAFKVPNPRVEQVPIGLGLSFPGSRSRTRVYWVNRVWQETEF
jgi:hypothetical protein